MSANIKASVDGTQAIIGVGGVDQMTVSNAGVVTANSFVGLNSSSVTATGSNAARTLANRFADVMNVKDFGAVGDWNSTTGTDNFTAFQNAIAALSTRGGTVYIPSGRYLCNGTLQLTDGIRIVGDGSINNNGSTQIVFGNTLGPCIRILESHCELKVLILAQQTQEEHM
jgi:polygalacturonase